MQTQTFDVVVVGAGPAGENVAGRCADGGLSAVIVERELVGGECSYWGCMPSKVLLRPGDALAAARRVPGIAGATETIGIDTAAVLAWRDAIVGDLDDRGQAGWLDSKGIDLVRGHARLAGPRRVVVARDGRDEIELIARTAVVIATGTRAAMPNIAGLVDSQPWDNRAATNAKEVPRRLLVLGGGAIGAEMAQAFRRLGSEQVTIIEGTDRLLPREEPFAGAELKLALEAEDIVILTNARAESVSRLGMSGPVELTLGDGSSVTGDELLVAVGRRPATGDIGLDTVGVTPGTYIEVDDRLRATAVEGGWLYAVGDCNGRSLLTHMGKYQARLAADAILGRDVRDLADAACVPRVTFTDPQVAAVGFTEQQARATYSDVTMVTYPLGNVAGSAVLGRNVSGTAAIVVDNARRVVVGATFTGPGVQELVHGATIAIAGEVGLDRLWHAVPAFPTVSEVWLRLLEAYGL